MKKRQRRQEKRKKKAQEKAAKMAAERAAKDKAEAERVAAEARAEADAKLAAEKAKLKARADTCRKECPTKLSELTDELKVLGTDELSIKRFHDIDKEHRELISQMPDDVIASTKDRENAFLNEYTKHKSAVTKAEEVLQAEQAAEAEKARRKAEELRRQAEQKAVMQCNRSETGGGRFLKEGVNRSKLSKRRI
jgi:hypothetical protein